MGHRKERLAHIIRSVVSDAITNRLSDPRISRLTSVTRVVLSPDNKTADVYVSVMGEDREANLTLKGLQSARGAIQTRLARQLSIRQCPILRIQLDEQIKQAINIIQEIDEISGGRGETPDVVPEDTDPSLPIDPSLSTSTDPSLSIDPDDCPTPPSNTGAGS